MMYVVLFVLLSLCAAGQPANVAKDKEAALGAQLTKEFEKGHSLLDDDALDEYVLWLGRRIDPASSFTFHVFAGDSCATSHEPVAYPGGTIYIPSALFTEAKDETAFARTIAHAMEHIRQQHFLRKSDSSTIPLVFVGGWAGGCENGLMIPARARAQREKEEADADAGAKTLMANFDPSPDQFATAKQIVRDLTKQPERKKPTLLRSGKLDSNRVQ